ncbi:MAG: hypothetical protein BKP49_11265 [Treponema sp. CETP13]|nr:MAG: hypothetical protein BKP49_11265 [Treponema sp. CETP13]
MVLDIFIKFFPIFFLLLIGFFLKKTEVLKEDMVVGLKKIIVSAGLPAILFMSFLTMKVEASYILLFAGTFIICNLLYVTGIILNKTGMCQYPFSPFFFTGFEFGMVGVALFTSLFGVENLHYILLIGLGHEFYIWFVYAPLLEAKNIGKVHFKKIIKSFFKSPIIIAILSALFLNLSGIYSHIEYNPIILGLLSSADILSGIVTPLILLIIGAQLNFKKIEWKSALHLIGVRLIVVGIFGTLLAFFTTRYVMDINQIMIYAFIIFFLLPPPFIITVFLGEKYKKENIFYNNLLVLYTPVTLIILMIVMFFIGA